MEKKKVWQIFIAFAFKTRAEKDTFEARRQSSKAELLGNSNWGRKVQGPSVCHQCSLKALGGVGGKWHPEAVYFMVSLKILERTMRTTFHHTAFRGPAVYWPVATRRWKASEQLWFLCPNDLGYHSNLIFGNSPRIGRPFACGTLISTLSTNRSQTESWSLAI